jgi:hypothetical protein
MKEKASAAEKVGDNGAQQPTRFFTHASLKEAEGTPAACGENAHHEIRMRRHDDAVAEGACRVAAKVRPKIMAAPLPFEAVVEKNGTGGGRNQRNRLVRAAVCGVLATTTLIAVCSWISSPGQVRCPENSTIYKMHLEYALFSTHTKVLSAVL